MWVTDPYVAEPATGPPGRLPGGPVACGRDDQWRPPSRSSNGVGLVNGSSGRAVPRRRTLSASSPAAPAIGAEREPRPTVEPEPKSELAAKTPVGTTSARR